MASLCPEDGVTMGLLWGGVRVGILTLLFLKSVAAQIACQNRELLLSGLYILGGLEYKECTVQG